MAVISVKVVAAVVVGAMAVIRGTVLEVTVDAAAVIPDENSGTAVETVVAAVVEAAVAVPDIASEPVVDALTVVLDTTPKAAVVTMAPGVNL